MIVVPSSASWLTEFVWPPLIHRLQSADCVQSSDRTESLEWGFITGCQSDKMNSNNFAQPVSNLQTPVDQVDEVVLAAHLPVQSQFHGALV